MADFLFKFLSEYLLLNVVFIISCVFLFYVFYDKRSSKNLSKKYRDSIFEAQTRIYLNATRSLISGDRDQAIKEFLNAIEVSKEALDAFFALGELFRKNGEIDKAIGVHQSIIARKDISEESRLKALKELAKDYDEGGFLDKAIDAYKDLLKLNKEDLDTIKSLCLIYEETEDWHEAIKFRRLLSKISNQPQDKVISHMMIQQAHGELIRGNYEKAIDYFTGAIDIAPSVSVKLFNMILNLIDGDSDQAKSLAHEFINEYPEKSYLLLHTLKTNEALHSKFPEMKKASEELVDYLLTSFKDKRINEINYKMFKLDLIKEVGRQKDDAKDLMNDILENKLSIDQETYISLDMMELLLDEGDVNSSKEVIQRLKSRLKNKKNVNQCSKCGYESGHFFWRCPQCHEWETINFKEGRV